MNDMDPMIIELLNRLEKANRTHGAVGMTGSVDLNHPELIKARSVMIQAERQRDEARELVAGLRANADEANRARAKAVERESKARAELDDVRRESSAHVHALECALANARRMLQRRGIKPPARPKMARVSPGKRRARSPGAA